jgi:hypothetical protein
LLRTYLRLKELNRVCEYLSLKLADAVGGKVCRFGQYGWRCKVRQSEMKKSSLVLRECELQPK